MTVDTGYTAAIEWLAANHPDLRLSHATTKLVPGPRVGTKTQQTCSVTLVPVPKMVESHGIAFEERTDFWLTGDSNTILDATKRAVGALK